MIDLDIHDIRVRLTTNDSALEKLLASYFHFLVARAEDRVQHQIAMEIDVGVEFSEPYEGRPSADGSALTLNFLARKAIAKIRPDDHAIRVEVISLEGLAPEVIFEFVFFQPLRLMLQHWGYFFAHASCAAIDAQRGMIFFGERHAGKSSMILSLLREGCFYLAEESALLRRDGGVVQVCSFPEDLGVSETSLANFPELRPFCEGHSEPYMKHRVPAEKAYPGRLLDRCIPRAVVFPQFSPDTAVRLDPISPRDALVELSKAELIVYTNQDASRLTREHLEVCAGLVEQAACYRLTYSDRSLSTAAQAIIAALRNPAPLSP